MMMRRHQRMSILFVLVREVGALHVVDIMADGFVDYSRQIGIAAQEFWLEAFVNAEHVVHYKHLSVGAIACTDADGGY